MVSWNVAKEHNHDASGIKNPELYDWYRESNRDGIAVYYPNEIVLKVIGSKWLPKKVKETIYWNKKDGSIKITKVQNGVELSVVYDFVEP